MSVSKYPGTFGTNLELYELKYLINKNFSVILDWQQKCSSGVTLVAEKEKTKVLGLIYFESIFTIIWQDTNSQFETRNQIEIFLKISKFSQNFSLTFV